MTEQSLTTPDSFNINLNLGEQRLDADFGVSTLAAIGDYVWFDSNADGVQDAGEQGIANATVNLRGAGTDGVYNTADDMVLSTQTDSNGLYLFNNLVSGDYRVSLASDVLTGGQTLTTIGQYEIALGNESVLTADFGISSEQSIGDTVWLDSDSDGVQDTDERGVSGVTVNLRGAGNDGILGTADDVIKTTTTDDNGQYLFDNLPVGDYQVTVDADPTQLTTDPSFTISLAAGDTDLSADFGLNQVSSIGDTVWYDTNADGIQDANERGLSGVTVNLRDAGADGILGNADDVLSSTTTDNDGLYLFDNLSVGRYQVTIDTDSPLTTASEFSIDLGSAEQNLTADFGLSAFASIGDRVWLDENADGVQDPNEQGVSGVEVTLRGAGDDGVLNTADDVVKTTITDDNGIYHFDALAPGLYQVSVDDGHDLSTPAQYQGVLAANQQVDQADFGLKQAGSIGDTVWFDADADGVQDPNETGIEGVSINLRAAGADGVLNTADDVLKTTVTDANGQYRFDGLAPDTYQVTVMTEQSLTTPDSFNINLDLGEERLDADFGVSTLAAIGDYVWFDSNADGVQDAGEQGIANATVNLRGAGQDGVYNTADDIVLSTETDSNGLYLFNNLTSGDYRVSLASDVLTGGQTLTTIGQYEIALGNESVLTADFGISSEQSIGDTVWLDSDSDGIQDADEKGLEGVKVTLRGAGKDGLFNTPDDLLQSTSTDKNGQYLFDKLPTGDYLISIDADPEQLTTAAQFNIRLEAGENDLSADFGLNNVSSIGDYVWFDNNADGIQDAGERGLSGVTVNLRDAGADGVLGTADDVLKTTTTDSNGLYLFDGLSAGTYQVTIDSDSPLTTPDQFTIDLPANSENLIADFGLSAVASIGDRVWLDENGDGIQDPNEPGVEGVTVSLRDAGEDGVLGTDDDIITTTETDKDGLYHFDNLSPNRYQVSVDEDNDLSTPSRVIVDLQAGTQMDDADFGLKQAGSIGDTVWFDSNGDGVQDPNEVGVGNIKVNLRAAGADGVLGTADDVLKTTTTDNQGQYRFDGLSPDVYQVSVLTEQNLTTPEQFSVELSAGETYLDADFGINSLASIGDYVWFDSNADGIQDASERGLSNVSISLQYAGADGLLNTADDVFSTTSTDATGLYLFDDLSAGLYQVSVNTDGNLTTVGSYQVDLSTGQAVRSADFGLTDVATISDRVWLDSNGDGVQDADEPGLAGVDVSLRSAGADGILNTPDDELFTVKTNEQGLYYFDNLQPGDYVVSVDEQHDLSTPADLPVSLSKGQTITDADFGIKTVASIGDTVWSDDNADGIQDPDEVGLAGVEVSLRDAGNDGILGTADDVLVTTTTDAQGQYRFDSLPKGNYQVSIADNGNLSTPAQVQKDLGAGEQYNDADFGIIPRASIGDTVWLDSDADGVQDPNERGLAGMNVELREAGADGVFNTADDLVQSTKTDSNGLYHFDNLLLGDYQVTLLTDNLSASERLSTVGRYEVNLDSNGFKDADFGISHQQRLGDRVWLDSNADGIQDAGERGVAGIDVNLRSAGADGILGTLDDDLQSTTTDAQGFYVFDALPTGDYVVFVDPALPLTTAANLQVRLDKGQSYWDADFGLSSSASIGDRVWLDSNGDGIEDAGERGLAGIDVNLRGAGADGIFNTADDLIRSTQTDANGNYVFDGLLAGEYQVSIDTNATLTTAGQFQVDLKAGENNLSADFGLNDVTSIGDQVWFDDNANGVQDAGERGLGNLQVTLRDAGQDGILGTDDDVLKTTRTDANGVYHFDDLPLGLYQVSLNSDNELSTPYLYDVELDSKKSILTADFGLTSSSSVSDKVWLDTDGDGVQDADEQGLSEVVVQLRDAGEDGLLGTADDVISQTRTNADGEYLFDGLDKGLYQVTVISDLSSTTPSSVNINLGTNQDISSLDFGLSEDKGQIGDLVWLDSNGNGLQDADEIGLSGVTVTLRSFGEDGIPNTADDVIRTTVTDSLGHYSFDALPEGDYSVTLGQDSLPEGLAQDQLIQVLSLDRNQRNDDIDFGLEPLGGIGDLVWEDQNLDGLANIGELGSQGIRLTLTEAGKDGLFDTADDIIQTTQTDVNGRYEFLSLTEGKYRLNLDIDTLPEGFELGTDTDAKQHFSLSVGEQRNDLDFRLIPVSEPKPDPDPKPEGKADYHVSKDDGLSQVVPGQQLRYQISVGNHGDGQGGNVIVVDNFPADVLEIIAVSDGGTVNPLGTITWNLSNLPANFDKHLSVHAQVKADAQGDQFTNVVTITDQNGDDSDVNDNTDSDTNKLVHPLDYVIVKTDGEDQVKPGQTLSYELTISNQGLGDGQSQFLVNDRFDPQQLQIVSVTHGGVINAENGLISWKLDGLAAGESITVTVTATVADNLVNGEEITNIGTVSAAGEQISEQRLDNNQNDDTNVVKVEKIPPQPQPQQGIHLGDDRYITPGQDLVSDRIIFNMAERDARTGIDRPEETDYGYYWPNGDIQFELPPLPVSPVFSGSVAPGTTMTVVLFDDHGAEIGTQTVMADTGGNWLASFPNVILWKAPHSIQIKQQVALYNHDDMSVYDMRTYFTPAITSQLFVSTPLSVQTVMAFTPMNMIHALHNAFQNPLAMSWDDFSSYQFQAASTTTTQSGM